MLLWLKVAEFWWGPVGEERLESATALGRRRQDLLLELLGGEGPATLELSDDMAGNVGGSEQPIGKL